MITDNTTKWKVRKFTDFASNQAMPLGYVHWSISPIVPAGELPLLGGTYDRRLYADLWSWANENGLVVSEAEWQASVLADGNCDKFSEGNGSTTFRVPKLPTTIASDVPSEVPVVGNGMAVGMTDGSINAGLHFTNDTWARNYPIANAYGANVGTSVSKSGGLLDSKKTIGITTDSTKSGIVAKTSATKITGQWLIVAFGVAHNIGEADIANVMQAVEQVQTSLGGVEDKVNNIKPFMPNYNAGVDITSILKTSPYSYTVPADGVILFKISDSGCWLINQTPTQDIPNSLLYIDGESGVHITSCLQVIKGQTIYNTGDKNGTKAVFYPYA